MPATSASAATDPNWMPMWHAFFQKRELDAAEFHAALRARFARRGRPAARAGFADAWRDIVEELAAEPRVLCHRDYHSRNLMLHDGRLVVIDFQDARMGPDTYDLASLVRDSYVDIDDVEAAAYVAYFRDLRARRPGAAPESTEAFQRRFDLMSLQRGLKALGTFGFQASVKGNTSYLVSVPRTLAHVGRTLRRYPRFARLHTLLAESIAELR